MKNRTKLWLMGAGLVAVTLNTLDNVFLFVDNMLSISVWNIGLVNWVGGDITLGKISGIIGIVYLIWTWRKFKKSM